MKTNIESRINTLQNGMKIHSLIAGDKNNPPVVLLHGYPSSSSLWKKCIPTLAEKFYVYAPDLPGHGRSDKPADIEYDLEFFVDFLKHYFDNQQLEQTSLVAHDLGGLAGIGFTAAYPERISKFIIMDTTPYNKWPLLANVLVFAGRNRLIARLILNRFLFTIIMKYIVYKKKHVVTELLINEILNPWIENSNSREIFSKLVDVPPERLTIPRSILRQIDVPTMILWATEDSLFPMSVAEQLHADLPNSVLEPVFGCGHFLQEEEPEIVSSKILSFLRNEMQKAA